MKNYLETTTQNVAWFKKVADENYLQIKPTFQRNLVWTDKQKSYLVDSILSGYPIPEIYLQETITSKGETNYIVVDGQQRIRATLGFIADEFSLDSEETTKWADMKFSDLSEADKKNYFAYKFVIRVLPEIEESELRNIFKRINKNNMSLNQQELRYSTYSGRFIRMIENLSDKDYWGDIGIFNPNKIKRMLDAEYISELVIAYLHGLQNKKAKLDEFYMIYEENFDGVDEVNNLFDTVIKEILQLLPEIKKTRWNNMTDFYTLFLVLSEKKDSMPFASDVRSKLSEELLCFGRDITTIQKGEDDGNIAELVKKYASGIRSSADLSSRRERHIALKESLRGTIF